MEYDMTDEDLREEIEQTMSEIEFETEYYYGRI